MLPSRLIFPILSLDENSASNTPSVRRPLTSRAEVVASNCAKSASYDRDQMSPCERDCPRPPRSVLLISQCTRLETIISAMLDTVEVQTVKISSILGAWQTLSTLHPHAVIVDLDIGVDEACDLLRKMRGTKHEMFFVAATSCDPDQKIRATESGADIFFESKHESTLSIFCFFIAKLGVQPRHLTSRVQDELIRP